MRGNFSMIIKTIAVFAFFIWFLSKMQGLLQQWRVKKSGDPDARIVVDKSTGWNYVVGCVFGLFKLIVILVFSTAIIAMLLSDNP